MRKGLAVLGFALAAALGSGNPAVAAEDTSRYIVRFEQEAMKSKNPARDEVISQLQQSLRKNMSGLNKVVKSHKNARITPLWIANAFAINASAAEIKKIAAMPNVAEVTKSEYKIFIDKDIKKEAVKNNPAVIQWGVQKVRAPEVWQQFKIDGAGGKLVLKEAFQDVLPADVLTRPKRGFSVPVGEWFRSEIGRQMLTDMVTDLQWPWGILDGGAVAALIESHLTGKTNCGHAVYMIYILHGWMKRNFG